ncbi:hypothetical protein AcV5_003583 [Taiwanofungus camphoratus]|nr:hypothetical protein AcV5_003583 [Antrodia cinnamomea]
MQQLGASTYPVIYGSLVDELRESDMSGLNTPLGRMGRYRDVLTGSMSRVAPTAMVLSGAPLALHASTVSVPLTAHFGTLVHLGHSFQCLSKTFGVEAWSSGSENDGTAQ